MQLYALATRFEFAQEGAVIHMGSTRLLVKLMEWEGRKGVQVCARCKDDSGSSRSAKPVIRHVRGGTTKGGAQKRRMWRGLQYVLDLLLQRVLPRW